MHKIDPNLYVSFRDACDDARLLDSKALLNHVVSHRQGQIDERESLRKEESLKSEEYREEWQKQMAHMEQVERDQLRNRIEMERQHKQHLREQRVLNAERKQMARSRNQFEDKQELDALHEAQEEERRLQEERRRTEHERGRQVFEYNQARKGNG